MSDARSDQPTATAGRSRLRANPSHLLASRAGAALSIAAVVWWLAEVTRSWGGWDAPATTEGAVLIAAAVVVVRPDRALPARVIALAAAISVGAVLVPLVAPVGWAGAIGSVPYICAAWLTVLVAATVVRWPASRPLLIVLVVTSAPIQFMSGWVAWWGGRNAAIPMVGTFYWHNPYAAFLIPGGILGLALWIWGERLYALLGVIGFVFAVMGIVYSTSRASFATLLLGVAAVALCALIDDQRLCALRQLVVGMALGAAAAYVVGGPPFFPHRSTPLSGTEARAVAEPLTQNSSYRLDFWREALTVFHHHPLTGGGYKSLFALATPLVSKNWPVSAFAHSGYLQALSDGGLLLGLPFLVSVALLAGLAMRAFVKRVRARDPKLDTYAVSVAFACVLVHSAVDFDWMYPASMAMAAILAGLVLGGHIADRADASNGQRLMFTSHAASLGRRLAVVGGLVVGVGALSLAAYLMRHGDHNFSLSQSGQRALRAPRDAIELRVNEI